MSSKSCIGTNTLAFGGNDAIELAAEIIHNIAPTNPTRPDLGSNSQVTD